ncbi:MAG: hypothetical protein AAF092_14345 [Pseudomonadota bacterium]
MSDTSPPTRSTDPSNPDDITRLAAMRLQTRQAIAEGVTRVCTFSAVAAAAAFFATSFSDDYHDSRDLSTILTHQASIAQGAGGQSLSYSITEGETVVTVSPARPGSGPQGDDDCLVGSGDTKKVLDDKLDYVTRSREEFAEMTALFDIPATALAPLDAGAGSSAVLALDRLQLGEAARISALFAAEGETPVEAELKDGAAYSELALDIYERFCL